MTEPVPEPLEAILRECAAAAPSPWYPRAYAETAGVARDTLDPYLERLRLRGLIRLTDWVAGNGQGYALTPEGERVLSSPGLLRQLRGGRVPDVRPTPPAEGRFRPRDVTTYERGETIREALLAPATPYVTYTLIVLNILVFLVGLGLARGHGVPVTDVLIGPGIPGLGGGVQNGQGVNDIASATGAITGVDLLRGQWWRLLTCCFVHFGVVHLAVNMYSLYVIGPLLERMWGQWRYLALYLIAGVGGSCVAVFFTPRGMLAGASGALWGLMASMLVWVLLNRHFLPRALYSSWLGRLLMVVVLNAVISLAPGISAAAHFGGGAVGALVGVFLNWQRFGRHGLNWLGLAGVAAVPVVCLALLWEAPRLTPVWGVLQMEMSYIPHVEHLRTVAEQRIDATRANTLLDQAPSRRDPAEVEKAAQALQAAQGDLTEGANLLRQAGPYRDAAVEEARQDGLKYLTAELKLLELDQRCLQKGENWTDQEELERVNQAKEAANACREWQSLFRPA